MNSNFSRMRILSMASYIDLDRFILSIKQLTALSSAKTKFKIAARESRGRIVKGSCDFSFDERAKSIASDNRYKKSVLVQVLSFSSSIIKLPNARVQRGRVRNPDES